MNIVFLKHKFFAVTKAKLRLSGLDIGMISLFVTFFEDWIECVSLLLIFFRQILNFLLSGRYFNHKDNKKLVIICDIFFKVLEVLATLGQLTGDIFRSINSGAAI